MYEQDESKCEYRAIYFSEYFKMILNSSKSTCIVVIARVFYNRNLYMFCAVLLKTAFKNACQHRRRRLSYIYTSLHFDL